MKVNLIMEEGRTVGWTIEAENTEERLTLGSIRNLEFWGTGEQKVQYNGMAPFKDDDNYVQSVKYATKTYKDAQKQAFRDSLKEKYGK